MKFILEITMAQKMALTDALVEHMRCSNSTEVFVDCSQHPPVKTTMGDLIRLLADAAAKRAA